MLKKTLSVLASIVMVSALFAGCGAKDNGSVIKIGAVFPLTGSAASYGKSSQKGLDLKVKEINDKGGINGKKIKVIYEDDEGKPQTSTNAVQKLINNEGAIAIVGPTTSGCATAAGPIATSSKIPAISGTATSEDVTTKGGEYVFRGCFIDPFQSKVLAKYASDTLHAKTAAMLYDVGSDYSKGLSDSFKKSFEAAGGKIVASETYNTGDTDFNAQLTKIKPLNADVLLLPDYYNTVGLIAKQARNDGIKSVFLGGDGWDSPELFKIGGDAVNGAIFSDHYSPEDTSQKVIDFKKNFEAEYKSTPDSFAALTYDAADMLFKAIQKAGSTDGTKIKDALKHTNDTFVCGKITFDSKRNPIKPAVIITAKNGKLSFLDKLNP